MEQATWTKSSHFGQARIIGIGSVAKVDKRRLLVTGLVSR